MSQGHSGGSRRRIIGIAGASCSGKSTIARALAGRLGDAVVLGLDAYYRDHSGVPEAHIEVDIPEALDQPLIVSHLRTLLRGEPIERPVYDYATHSRLPRTDTVDTAGSIIIEGLFTFYWDDVLELLDTKVFVFADPGVCLTRRIERDVRERGQTREQVEERWHRSVLPMYARYVHPSRTLAAIQLDGTRPTQELVDRILDSL